MATFRLDTLAGAIEAVVWPDVYERVRETLADRLPVMVCGTLGPGFEHPKLTVRALCPLDEVPPRFTREVRIHVPPAAADTARLEEIRDVLREFAGAIPVTFCLLYPTGEEVFIRAGDAYRVAVSEALVHALETRLGENAVYLDASPEPCA